MSISDGQAWEREFPSEYTLDEHKLDERQADTECGEFSKAGGALAAAAEEVLRIRNVASDGGPSSYYDFPEGARTLNDVIEHQGMEFAQANIFKACMRLGNKEGATREYDLKKIIYFANRLLAKERGVPYGERDKPQT